MEPLLAEYLHKALLLILTLSAVPLLTSMFLGFILSVLQAATQIQEQTLSFVPKLIGVTAAVYFAWPYLGQELSDFSLQVLGDLHLLGSH